MLFQLIHKEMEAILYGLNAGLGVSPHTLGMILAASVYGRRSGLQFMLGALVWDFVLIICAVTIQGQLSMGSMSKIVLHLISGLLIIRMGIKAIHKRKPQAGATPSKKPTWINGMILQIFNPNPYVFWFAIGVPHMLSVNEQFSEIKFAGLFLLVTYGIKYMMMDFSSRISQGSFENIRKIVASATIANGVYVTFVYGKELIR